MEDDWDLEDWLLDAGEAAEHKHVAGATLSPIETLTRELWVFDMHSLNGGVSQYFFNYPKRWPTLADAASSFRIEPLDLLVTRINEAIRGSNDPYSAVFEANGLNEFFQENRLSIWRRVHSLANAD